MPKVPEPRKEDEKGGGRHEQAKNRSNSQDRGGRPHAGGAGNDEKPKDD